MVGTLDDEVDLVLAALGPQVPDFGLGGLGAGADPERDERLEEPPEQRAGAWNRRSEWLGVKQGRGVRAEQAGGQRGIGQVVLGWMGKPGNGAAGRQPPG